MSFIERIKKVDNQAPCEEKLMILRHESLHLLGVIRASAKLLKDLDIHVPKESSNDFDLYTTKISEAGDKLLEIVEVLTESTDN
jgi:hypothetical protein